MSQKVFEYFFEPEDLEPFYSELQGNPAILKLSERLDVGNQVRELRTESYEPTDASAQSTVAEVESIEADPEPHLHEPSTAEPHQEEVEPAAARVVGQPRVPPARSRVRSFVSVHALGQYIFCPRSAIIAAETGDQQDPEEMPRLTYLPNYDLAQIEELLGEHLRDFGNAVFCLLGSLSLMVVGSATQHALLFYSSFAVFFCCLLWVSQLVGPMLRLAARRRAAMKAEPAEMDIEVSSIQTVNWWSLLKSGFEPVRYERQFRHPELPLEGSPWRVLRRGSLRIPIIRTGSDKLGPKKGQVFLKHQVRLAAYALLVETTPHLRAPFGVVFPQGSPCGLAVPLDQPQRDRTVEALNRCAHVFSESQLHQIEPGAPEDRKRCEGCQHGRPESLSEREILAARKASERLLVLESEAGRKFHCTCGDRFGNAPPHRDSVKLGLKAALE